MRLWMAILVILGATLSATAQDVLQWISVAGAEWRVNGQARSAVGYSGIKGSKSEAEASAIAACRSAGGQNCRVLGSYSDGCMFVVSGSSATKAGYGGGGSPEDALNNCRNEGLRCSHPIGGCIDPPREGPGRDREADPSKQVLEGDRSRDGTPALGLNPEQRFRDCPTCPEMVVIPPGSFMMGSPPDEQGRDDDEGPQHKVTIGQTFAAGRTHITRGEYAEFVRESGHKQQSGCRILIGNGWSTSSSASWQSPGYTQTDLHPVVCIRWLDAIDYVLWLSAKTGKQYRLLSEAEAEYIARGTTSPPTHPTRYWFGNSEAEGCKYANGADQTARRVTSISPVASCDDGFAYTAPVGSFKANAFGLHDVAGNVWTWTQDCWNEGYDGAPDDGSAWTSGDCKSRVIRGAAWSYWPRYLRAAARDNDPVGARDQRTGFRVARSM